MIGARFGSYEILEEVGKGGMATVYRARQPAVERDVAIKVIQKSIASDEAAVQRFQREARLIARLEHPHILPVYDFDGMYDPPYIVMRYLDSGTLKDVLKQGQLPADEIAYLMRQVASALDYAHRQGIVHRDIKPTNIMIDREGNAFVTDFGIARITTAQNDNGDGPITATGVVVGTPDYMSPEQALGEDTVDHRTDIYALGVMLFQMLTGELPFVSPAPTAVLMMHISNPIPSALTFNDSLPEKIDEVLSCAMAKNRDDRYTSANDFALAVAGALGGTVTGFPTQLRTAAGESIVIRKKLGARTDKSGGTDSDITPPEQQKQVTVLYANLTEFVELVEDEADDPMDVRQGLWERLDNIIAGYGGSIDNHTGDAVLAIWGVRSVSEDDPERAVQAALAIQQEIKLAGKDILSSDDDEPLPVQIGIHTGIALLKRDESSGIYNSSGPTVNTASRLERAAPTGGILISTDTYNYVRGVFLVEGLEPMRLRGSKEPMQVYLVRGAKVRAFRQSTQGVEGVETKTIGRDGELKQLIEALETAAEDEETQVITIIGEAGVGKTRLLFEVSEWEEKQVGDFYFFSAHATPQMIHQPFALIRELLTYRFEVQDSDDSATVQEKFEQGIARFMGDGTTEQAHIIAYLLGLNFTDNIYLQNRDAQQLNLLAQKYLTDFLVKVARTTVGSAGNEILGLWMQLENIHWADDRSLDYINQLVEDNPDLPLAVICTARPSLYERRPTWGSGQDFHERLDLRPLSKRDSRKLVREILQKVDLVPDELRDLIVERSEGNPFYMEELVKMLVEDRVIIKGDEKWVIESERLAQARVPVTLTGLLQARLDSLLTEERITLQRAAVIGRVFWDSALKGLQSADNMNVDIHHALEVLARRELIYLREETAFAGTQEFIFKSTMLRDVTYESILKRQQRNYHFEVGNWLVRTAGARISEYTAQIAEHYEIAGENVLAAEYLYRTGENVLRVSAYAEALNFFERSLSLVKGQVDIEARRLQSALHYCLGDIAQEQGDYESSDRNLHESLQIARELGDKKRIIEALNSLGLIMSRGGAFDISDGHLQEALKLAREINDKPNMAFALTWLGANETKITATPEGFERGVRYLSEALALAQETGEDALAARALNILGENARYQQKYSLALQHYEEALPIYRHIGNAFGIGLVTGNMGHVARAMNQFDDAWKHYRDYIHIAENIRATTLTIDGVAGIAGIKAETDEKIEAAELLGLVLNHPTCDEDARVIANPILEGLRATLKPDTLEAAMERGKKLNLDAVVKRMLER